ncbi:acetyl-CoA hydrolase/transferase family protein [Phycicoccus duodecadis]|uniref:Acyl-CoA hydrolase n=1 Tax=Phycicoccus duodecadis TaxID=173053 RepID=A0A2N3YM32_9MICO|nr:acetyl-CoA hydrolase/transferase C-terminal domain-containing protein [Phycicoccus duodecadis]PKW27869.1 acyl-CoA hydrolase [Phycicoccus duodecadis]
MRTVGTDELGRHLAALPGRPRVVVSGNVAVPWEVVRLLDAHCESYVLHALNAPAGIPDRPGVTAETCFVGPGMRRHSDLSYVPSRLSMVPVLYRGPLAPDVVVVHCAPPRDGMLSLGIEVNVLPAAVEACRARSGLVVAVVNEAMPYTGGDALLDVTAVDLAVEVTAPLPSLAPPAPDDDSRLIGERVASRVGDGATLQAGIGSIPDATIAALAERRGLRVWTEMFSDGVVALDRAGALDPDHPLITSFLFGSDELYAWADGNPRVRMTRTETTNDPALIARQRAMTSVNSALEVDLFGQANASRIDARIHSGFGGQTDFVVGALHSPGGQAFIALRSWHPKADCSTVVPLLDEPVTSVQQSAVVTEQGIAELYGHDQRAQCRHLIRDAAHPRVRDELWEEARALGLA